MYERSLSVKIGSRSAEVGSFSFEKRIVGFG